MTASQRPRYASVRAGGLLVGRGRRGRHTLDTFRWRLCTEACATEINDMLVPKPR